MSPDNPLPTGPEGQKDKTTTEKRTRAANRSACEQCKRRKIRCAGEKPFCNRCVRMGKDCTYPVYPTNPDPKEVEDLQSQIHALEARRHSLMDDDRTRSASHVSLSPVSLRHPHNNGPGQQQRYDRRNSRSASPTSDRYSVMPTPPMSSSTPAGRSDPQPAHTVHHVHSTGEKQDPAPRYPRYEAISTTYPKPHDRPLPSNDQVLLHLSSDLGVGGIFEPGPSRAHAPLTQRPTSLVTIDRSILPSAQDINALCQHFQEYTSAAFPIFYLPELRTWIENVCFKGEAMEAECVCAVLLVLAVSATSVPIGSAIEHLKPRAAGLWEYGQKYLPPVFLPPIDERRGLLRVQVMLIRLQYVLHNPRAGNVWGLSGAAVRASVDLGLHHEGRSGTAGRSAIEVDIRRRVFWISYSCDRDLGMALGRPPAIQDEWVTTAFPSDRDDSLITPTGILGGPLSPHKLTALHIFRIRKLQSEIIHRLYASTIVASPPPSWFDTMQRSIDEWQAGRPPGRGFCSEEWLNLCFHQTITLLHRPCPGNSSPSRESLDKALNGSSSTMRLYKETYRSGRISFGWLSMYHLFISGVTYLNSLWQAYRNGWRLYHTYVDALLDMQVCTSVMEGLAALTPEASSIRNTWEVVSEKMIRQLSTHVKWDPQSRPGSPSHNIDTMFNPQPIDFGQLVNTDNMGNMQQQQQQPFDMIGGLNNNNNSNNNDPFAGLVDNPFDSFLLQPLGEMTTDDWTRAVASVFGTQTNEDLSGQFNGNIQYHT